MTKKIASFITIVTRVIQNNISHHDKHITSDIWNRQYCNDKDDSPIWEVISVRTTRNRLPFRYDLNKMIDTGYFS